MSFSLPDLWILPHVQDDSAGMPNFAAVGCWRTSIFKTLIGYTYATIPCVHYGIPDSFRGENAL